MPKADQCRTVLEPDHRGLHEVPLVYGVPSRIAGRAIKKGILPCFRLSRKLVLLKKDDIERWIEGFRDEPGLGDVDRIVAEALQGVNR
jgi:hypothetical protein